MQNYFDDLSADALGRMDDVLSHIAETEQLTDAENSRIFALARQKAGFAPQKAQPLMRHGRFKLFGVLIAAVMAAGGTLCASAYLTHNRSLQANFLGDSGAAVAEQIEMAEPQTYDVGNYTLTVDSVLYDGITAYMLCDVQVTGPDAEEIIRWKDVSGFIPQDFCDAAGNKLHPAGGGGEIRMADESEYRLENSHDEGGCRQFYFRLYFRDLPEDMGDTLIMKFPKGSMLSGKFEPGWLRGLEVPVTLTQNVELVRFASETGKEVLVSDFEIVAENRMLVRASHDYFIRNDGTEEPFRSTYSAEAGVYSILGFRLVKDGADAFSEDSAEYAELIDVQDYSAVVINNVRYDRVQP